MKIHHRLTKHFSQAECDALRAQHVEVSPGFGTLILDESHPTWSSVANLIRDWDLVDLVSTEFTTAELRAASYLQIKASWHCGYPQPEQDSGYLERTYDLTQYCPTCGQGKIQDAPFLMTSEPAWGNRGILQLNWVFDAFFTTPQVWREVFEPFGIGALDVMGAKPERLLKTVVQLDICAHATSAIPVGHESGALCDVCQRTKLVPHVRGPFPTSRLPPGIHIGKTKEVFGSGASAWSAVIVSKEVYEAMHWHKVRGITFAVAS